MAGMKRALLLVLLLCLRVAADPKPASLISNVSGRTTLSLNGTWRVIVDPDETGLSDRFYEDRKPKDKTRAGGI
jgi:beta-glucuronidase